MYLKWQISLSSVSLVMKTKIKNKKERFNVSKILNPLFS